MPRTDSPTSRYRIERLLGAGGIGKVFLAYEGKQAVALKFLQSGLEPKLLNYFREEVRLLAQLSHPNLVKIYDFFEQGSGADGFHAAPALAAEIPRGAPVFAMEYVEGQAIDRLPKESPLGTWIDLLAQIAQGLHYLHSRNILHRDLKPSNLFLTPKGVLKILDFSISSTLEGGSGGGPMGSLPYMPPEAFFGEFDFRSDLFAVGVCFFGMLTGKLPFNKPLTQSGIEALKPRESLQRLRPDLPEYFCDLIESLLELAPSRRPGSARTVLRILQEHSEAAIQLLEEDAAVAILQKTPLVGREREMARLTAAAPKLVLLTGPTGIGRSRLLEEFKWHQLLNHGPFLSLGPEAVPRWLPSFLEKIAGGEVRGEADFLSLMDQFIRDFAARPLVLACTDLQSWPESALRQLEIFSRSLRQANAKTKLILEYNSELREAIFQEPEEDGTLLRLELRDLSAAETRKLLTQANFGRDLPLATTEAIVQASGGRPLLILEAWRQLLSGGDTLATEATWRQLPKNLEEASRLRVQRLSTAAQGLLGMILTASEPPALEELIPLWQAANRTLEATALELDRGGFIVPRGPEQRELRLAHPSLHRTLLAALPEAIRNKSHRLWLEFLQKDFDPKQNDDPRLLRILEHAFGADDPSVQVRWGIEALQALARRGDFEKAVAWSERLLAVKDPALNRCALLGHRAPYCYRLGKFDEALAAYEGWYQLRADDETRLQRVKYFSFTGLALFSAGRDGEARERLEECLRTGDSQAHASLRPHHARAHNLLAVLAEKRGGDLPGARAHLEQALNLGEGEASLSSETEQRLGSLAMKSLRFDEAEGHFRRALDVAAMQQEPQVEALAWNCLAMLQKERGELRLALASMEQALRLARRGGELLQSARYLGNHAALLLELGDYSTALEALRRSEGILKILGHEEAWLVAQLQLTHAYLRIGNRERLLSQLGYLEAKQPRLQAQGLWSGLLALKAEEAELRGDWDSALKIFRDSLLCSERSGSLATLQTRLDAWRARGRGQAIPPEDEETRSLLQELGSLPGLSFSAWRGLLDFFGKNLATSSEAELSALLEAIAAQESPDLSLDLQGLLALHLHRHGFEEISQGLARLCRQVWNRLHQQLPEEYRMDFEKNRSLSNLEAALKTPSEPPRAASTAAPSPSPPSAAPGRTQIPESRFRHFCEISRQIAQKGDLNEILERVMDAAIELSGAERGFLLLKSDDAKKGVMPGFEVHTARHLNQQSLKQEEFQFSFSVLRQAIDQGVPLLTDNAQQDARFREAKSIHQFQLQSILVVPLEIEGQVLGALYLDHRYQPDCFSPEDVAVISGFASQAGLAIQKARMMEELRQAKEKLEHQVKDQAEHIEVLADELSQSRKNLKYEYSDIIGQSPAMLKIFQLLDHVTKTKIPVWIWGESGTGKELIARSLHFNSPRKNGPYVTENCSAIPENLLESELFGFKKGAFTHADRDRIGLFEQASGGTLFLDEVADMSLGMQVKLLRVLQEGEIRPLGSNKKVQVDVRLVTASNRDLQALVKEGKFRQDLLFRINGMTLRLPPLRERKEDIPLLVHFLIKKISKEFDLKPSAIHQDAFQLLMKHPWPGNIRELEGVVRNLLLFANGKTITRQLCAQHRELLLTTETPATPEPAAAPPNLDELPEAKVEERRALIDALVKHRMDKKRVSEDLGISLKSVYARMQRYAVPKKNAELARFLKQSHSE